MKTEIIKSLISNFESYANKTSEGVEFWLARDLQQLLGYDKWDNFLGVISKAKTACENTNKKVSDHFADVGKMINIGKGGQREVSDMMLTRYACYLIAQNGDSRKEKIAFAQNYFAVQTRKFEIIEQRIKEFERVVARQKLTETEKELSGVIYQQTGSDKNFALIRSKGDKALFGYTTQEMKHRLGVPEGRALADFQPTIILKAKDFATEITIFNSKSKSLQTEQAISEEHITNNRSVRKTLISRGIIPERGTPSVDTFASIVDRPVGYDKWFIAGYPDVVDWFRDVEDEEMTNILGGISEENALDAGHKIKFEYLRKMVNVFKEKKGQLECSDK